MNWGKGIAIFIVCFMFFLGALVYASFQIKVPLVSEDYYEQEINYQEKINARIALGALGEVELKQVNNTAVFQLPLSGLSEVSIKWICFNDQDQDFETSFTTNESGEFVLDLAQQKKGHYDLKIDITSDNKYYYSSKRFIIQ